MTASGPWSVKGIDPKAREIAKDLARRSGMTLGEWLNQMIIDGGDSDPPAPEPVPETRRRALDDLYREARAARPGGAPPSMLGDTAEVARVARTLNDLALRMEAAEQRSGLAISGVDQSVVGVLSRMEAIEREHGQLYARAETSAADVRATQARILEKLQRMEHDDGARVDAFKTLETALGRVADQMQAGDARGAELADEVRQTETRLSKRLEMVETAAAAAPDAFADADKVDVVLSRMAERLDEAETRTTAAVRSLQSTFAGLDVRLRGSEARSAGPTAAEVEGRFQTLAQELSKRVETARTDMAERLRAAAEGRLDSLEATLRDLRGHVDQAEQRSAQAIDRIGREVIRVAHGLGERVSSMETGAATRAADVDARIAEMETRAAEVDARSAAATETLGGEVARIADTVDSRMRRADEAQAEALERLGGEIARIAERLADRISSSDRRAAEAIDEVTERVAGLGDRMEARHDRSATELSDRIRQSEDRTAKLLDDARERLEQSLGARPAPVAATAPHPLGSNADPFGLADMMEGPETAFEPPPAPPLSAAPVYVPSAFGSAKAAAEPSAGPPGVDLAADDFSGQPDPFADRPSFLADISPFDPEDDFVQIVPRAAETVSMPAPEPQAEPAFMPAAPAFTLEPSVSAFAPSFEAEAPSSAFALAPPPPPEPQPQPLFDNFSVSDFAPPPEPPPSATQMSTREMLDAARQAARSASGRQDGAAAPGLSSLNARAPKPFGLTLPGRRKKDGAPTLRTIALASVTAGAITTAAVGAYMLGGASHDGAPDPSHPQDVAASTPTASPSLAVAMIPPAAADQALSVPDQTAAVLSGTGARATAGHPVTPAKGKAAPASTTSPRSLYASAVSRIESGDLTAVADLKTAATQGDIKAQFYLARLYEAGGAGLPKDLAEARRWTQKAAEGGDSMAMYNLASYAYAGDGGAKDLPTAVTWFRRAAERGVVNGQYNLAQLYEKGYGVPQDLGQAYSWYAAAAEAGDPGAKLAAAALKRNLSPTALVDADKRMAALRASLATGTASGAIKTAAAKPGP